MCKLIHVNTISGSCLLISSLPGSASRTHIEWLGSASLAMSASVLEAMPGKLDIRGRDPNILFSNALEFVTRPLIG